MELLIPVIVAFVVSGALFGALGFWMSRTLASAKAEAADNRAEELVAQAQREAENIRREAENVKREAENVKREAENHQHEAEVQAKDYLFRAKSEFEKESRAERKEIQDMEKGLVHREEGLEKRVQHFDQRNEEAERRVEKLQQREQQSTTREEKLSGLEAESIEKLEQIAGMSAEEAKRKIVQSVDEAARRDGVRIAKKIEEEAKETGEIKAKYIIANAIQRYAGEYVAERTITVFPLPTDELKGRIIGREGRNIRALELATGVDLIVDDTPETVVISCHNPIRREIARRTLESLIADGRIHPTRIEDTVAKMADEVDASLKETGEQALYELGIQDVHPEVVRTLGMLKYRTSYTQNVLTHSMEAAFLCGMMASELGLDPKQARRAALMHDLGKAVTHEVDGPHAMIGGEMAEKYGEHPVIVHAIAAHHEDIEQEGILPVLVQAADAISGARPGARRETLSNYVQRLEDLERIATSFEGIDKSFAIQAGRELRVIVESKKVDDTKADLLARDIAGKIEDEMQFPGQIKVTVIRETRCTHFAR